jgi:hypothetical protein
MKVTKGVVKLFESDQKAYGTQVALANMLWLNAVEQLEDIGVKHTRTTYGRKPRKLELVKLPKAS